MRSSDGGETQREIVIQCERIRMYVAGEGVGICPRFL